MVERMVAKMAVDLVQQMVDWMGDEMDMSLVGWMVSLMVVWTVV